MVNRHILVVLVGGMRIDLFYPRYHECYCAETGNTPQFTGDSL